MKKDLFELTIEDLEDYPIWYFPMNEDLDEETTIKPILNKEILDLDYSIIVRTCFKDKSNKKYIGFVYWGTSEKIGHIQPTIISGKDYIYFWSGRVKPSEEEIRRLNEIVNFENLPLKYESENIMNLKSITGIVEGLYYYDDTYQVKCINSER